MYYVYVAGYILLAAAMQLFTGNFPVSFLAFPLNIIFAAIWLFLLWILYKEYKNHPFSRFIQSQCFIYQSVYRWLPDHRTFPPAI